MPEFDLDHEHRIELQNERPILLKRLPGQSDAHYQKLCDGAYDRAAAAKVANDKIRKNVAHYASQGVIEVVSDPFAEDEEVEGLAELAEAIKAAQESETPTTTETVQLRNKAA